MIENRLGLGNVIPHSNQLQKKYEKIYAQRKTEQTENLEGLDDRTKQRILDIQSIESQEANRDKEGEAILQKAESGKELSQKELNYLAEKYPEAYRKIKSAQMERQILKSQMEASENKAQTAVAFSTAIKRVKETAEDDWEFKMRSNQLSDEYAKYKKTDEYKEKPSGTLDEDEKENFKKNHRINTLV